eukprot:RCo043915
MVSPQQVLRCFQDPSQPALQFPEDVREMLPYFTPCAVAKLNADASKGTPLNKSLEELLTEFREWRRRRSLLLQSIPDEVRATLTSAAATVGNKGKAKGPQATEEPSSPRLYSDSQLFLVHTLSAAQLAKAVQEQRSKCSGVSFEDALEELSQQYRTHHQGLTAASVPQLKRPGDLLACTSLHHHKGHRSRLTTEWFQEPAEPPP